MTSAIRDTIWETKSLLSGNESISREGDIIVYSATNYGNFKQHLENLISGETQDMMQGVIDSISTDSANEYTLQLTGLDELLYAEQLSPDAKSMITQIEKNIALPVIDDKYYSELYEQAIWNLSGLPDHEIWQDLFERGNLVFGPVYIQTILKERLEKAAESSKDRKGAYLGAAKSMNALLKLSKDHYNPEKGMIFNIVNAQDLLLAKKVQLYLGQDIAKGVLDKIESARDKFEEMYSTKPSGISFGTDGLAHVFEEVNGNYQKLGIDLETSPKTCEILLQCYDANLQNYLQ